MCFGPSDTEKNLASTATSSAAQEQARRTEAFKSVQPYAVARMEKGIPELSQLTDFSKGEVAKNTGLMQNDLSRRMAFAGIGPTDPAGLQLQADAGGARARSFDQLLLEILGKQDAAKGEGARLLTAIASGSDPYTGLGLSANILRG